MSSRPVLIAVVLAAVLGAAALAMGEGTSAAPTSAGPMGSSASKRATASTSSTGGSVEAAPPDRLDPGLVAAYEQARSDAADAGHDLVINSGFRTPERQQELLEEEILERGSYEEATRWVFTPDRSMHVQGLAIDVGDGNAATWLQEHGARYGLCHTLAWEWWHFEWRQRWQDAGECPPEAQDPADAPGR